MRQYGLIKTIKGLRFKRDCHAHADGKRLLNWWEVITKPIPRSTMNHTSNKNMIDEAYGYGEFYYDDDE